MGRSRKKTNLPLGLCQAPLCSLQHSHQWHSRNLPGCETSKKELVQTLPRRNRVPNGRSPSGRHDSHQNRFGRLDTKLQGTVSIRLRQKMEGLLGGECMAHKQHVQQQYIRRIRDGLQLLDQPKGGRILDSPFKGTAIITRRSIIYPVTTLFGPGILVIAFLVRSGPFPSFDCAEHLVA